VRVSGDGWSLEKLMASGDADRALSGIDIISEEV
jgi:hypothetical protein